MRFHFSKNRKNTKKWKKYFFLLKMYTLVPKLWYMFSKKIIFFYFSAPKIIFYVFHSNLKKSSGLRWRWRWRWRWKNFHWEMLRKSNGQLPTYIGGPEKIWGQFPMLNFSRRTPTLGWFFPPDSKKVLKIAHFCVFRHIGGVEWVRKNMDLKI